MVKKSKISPTKVDSQKPRISPYQIDEEKLIAFNFKYLCRKSNEKFNYEQCDSNYFFKLLERLKAISLMNIKDLRFIIQTNPDSIRFHRLEFRTDMRLKEKTFGLGDDKDDEAYQFEISAKKHGRIHGFLIENIFFIVWLDPKHELYG
jgi:hypothetical protein